MRRKAGKILIYFCVLMLCCTVIARAASSVTVAKVQTVKMGKGVLTQTVTGSGSVVFKEQKNQSLPEGQKIKSILIKPQTPVQEGDQILQLDMDYLEEELEKKNREIEKLELQLKQQSTSGAPDARTPETAQAQIALNAAADALNQARADYDEAEAEYYNIINNPPVQEDFPETVPEAENKAVPDPAMGNDAGTPGAAADSAVGNSGSMNNGSVNDSSANGGSTSSGSAYAEARQRWEQEAEAARQKMESAADAVESQTIAYNQAAEQYNLAEQSEANTKKNQEKNAKANAISLQSLQVDIDGAREELKKLTEIQEKQGIVSAKASGIFQSVGAVEGAFTTGTEQIIIASGEIEAQGILAPEDVGKIAPEDKIEVTLSGQSKSVEVKVARLEPLPAGEGENALQGQESGAMAWYGDLENKNNQIITGSALTYESHKETGSYDQVIPLSSVHQEQGSFYVLTAEVRDGILGKVYTAVRVPATLIDKDEEKAAVKVVADREALIISSSSKYVEEGDQVRLE